VIISLKRCVVCHRWKSLEAFSKWVRGKDGRQPKCKTCVAAYYSANRDRILPQIKANNKRAVQECRLYVWNHLRTHPCVDCGESDPVVLDFDHVTGEKRAEVSTLARGGHRLKTVKAEMAKCEIRCANCHRRRTSAQLGWNNWRDDVGVG
jgi:hypothetical protein